MSPPRPPNFDPVARLYRWAEYLALGPLLTRTRNHFLPQLSSSRQAFVLGDGDGRFLATLLRRNRTLDALAVDSSLRMLHLLRHRCRFAGHRLQTLHASALATAPPPNTDLIVTHFFLDCLTQPELDHLAQQLAHAAQPGTLWLLSDFAIPTAALLKPLAAAYIRGLYFAFRILTGLRVTRLPDPQSALAAAGFTPIARHSLCRGLLFTELWQLKPPADEGQRNASKIARGSLTSANSAHHLMSTNAHPDRPSPHLPSDAQSDPEPAAPSLSEPDPGIFHPTIPNPIPDSEPTP
jgi:hypothetical protein